MKIREGFNSCSRDVNSNETAEAPSPPLRPASFNFQPAMIYRPSSIESTFSSLYSNDFVIRSVWTLVLCSVFALMVLMGHLYLMCFVSFVVISGYYELISLHDKARNSFVSSDDDVATEAKFSKKKIYFFLSKTKDILSFVSLETYFLIVTLYCVSVPWLLPRLVYTNQLFRNVSNLLLSYHYLVTFISSMLGIIKFILSLEKGKYKKQFLKLAFIIISLLYIVMQSLVIINNIYFGMIWMILPHIMIIVNDVFAYMLGKIIGKTPLIALSPKKTVEGFICSGLITILIVILITPPLLKIEPLLCPVDKFHFTAFAWINTKCQINDIYISKPYLLPLFLQSLLGIKEIYYSQCTLHMIFLAVFVSLFAPFGGFLASGLKRTFKVKDFSDAIPGHGGVVDRFDCHIIMGSFTYFYIKTFVKKPMANIDVIFNQIIKLPKNQQLQLLQSLQNILK